MKKPVILILSFATWTHAQFNLQFNNQGFRFGLLGAEVVNVGGANKDKVFQETFPNVQLNSVPFFGPIINEAITPRPYTAPPNMGTISQPTHGPAPAASGVGLSKKNQEQKKEIQEKIETAQVIKPVGQIPTKASEKITSEEKENSKGKVLQITPIQIKEDLKIEIEPASQAKINLSKEIVDLRQGKSGVTKDAGSSQVEQQIKQLDVQMVRQREEQRLVKFIHFLPDQQKQHLRAMSSAKTNS